MVTVQKGKAYSREKMRGKAEAMTRRWGDTHYPSSVYMNCTSIDKLGLCITCKQIETVQIIKMSVVRLWVVYILSFFSTHL
jgi:hypothetical protein